jgi:hypothetical protein
VITSAVTGALAGLLMGYVLQRGQLCFHSAIRNSLDGRFLLARGWALGVALASVGLALLFLLPGTSGLNRAWPSGRSPTWPVDSSSASAWSSPSRACPDSSTSWAQACSARWSG